MYLAIIILVLLIFIENNSTCAQHKEKNIPKIGNNSFFAWPIPKSKALSGTFAELRDGAFHYGLDITTYDSIGFPVMAAADGEVFRVLCGPSGYGKAIYMKHSGGYITVYGHLDKFENKIDQAVYAQQIQNRKFYLEWFPPAGKYKFKKGDIIGWSGNTGGSTGPHLHFEIRSSGGAFLNPLNFLAEIVVDTIPPELQQVAFEPLSPYARIEGDFAKCILVPKRLNDSTFIIDENEIRITGPVGFEFTSEDKNNYAPRNRNGLYAAELLLDGEVICKYKMDQFIFSDGESISQFIDYPHYKKYGERLQKMYVEPGNQMSMLKALKNKGIIELRDDQSHLLELKIMDHPQNTTYFRAHIRKAPNTLFESKKPIATDTTNALMVYRKALKLFTPNPRSVESTAWLTLQSGKRINALPEYRNGLSNYIFPLNPTDLPVSVTYGNQQVINIQHIGALLPQKPTTITNKEGNIILSVAENTVYDTTYLFIETIAHTAGQILKDSTTGEFIILSDTWKIGERGIPVKKNLQLLLPHPNPKNNIPANKYVCARINDYGIPENIFLTTATENGLVSSISGLGNYCIIADTAPPTARPNNFIPNDTLLTDTDRLSFKVKDGLSGISSLYLTIDNQWVLTEYYPANDLAYFLFRNPLLPGKHTANLDVTDRVGNRKQYEWTFYTR